MRIGNDRNTVYIYSMSSRTIHGPLRDAPTTTAIKGRGTAWAIDHRFTRQVGEACDDGWGLLDQQAS